MLVLDHLRERNESTFFRHEMEAVLGQREEMVLLQRSVAHVVVLSGRIEMNIRQDDLMLAVLESESDLSDPFNERRVAVVSTQEHVHSTSVLEELQVVHHVNIRTGVEDPDDVRQIQVDGVTARPGHPPDCGVRSSGARVTSGLSHSERISDCRGQST